MDQKNKDLRIDMAQARSDIREIFLAAVENADAGRLVRNQVRLEGETLRVGNEAIDLGPFHRIHVLGIGKAAAHMALPFEEILGDRLTGGLVIVKEGHVAPLRRIQVREAGHPIPDERGLRATDEMVSLLKTCREDDLILFLVSGGGSALLVAPEPGLTLEDKIETTKVLLLSGASIHKINAIRRHLSAVKGGKVVPLAYPAALVGLILSDVVGDRLEDIASGPTIISHEASGLGDIERILPRYNLRGKLPKRVVAHLETISSRAIDPPQEDHRPLKPRVKNILIGNNESLLDGARNLARELGYTVHILSRELQGEAREAAVLLSSLARTIREKGAPVKPPACLLAGGETTVIVKGGGKGGRCQEFALASAVALEGENIIVLAAGSDGTDGPTDAAGAVVDGETCRRARALSLNPHDFLLRNDSHTFFRSLGDLLITGPTRTNVMDLYAFLIP